MPLAFDCISHGTVAFGFFNIYSDMLLLEHYFFFAPEFCRHICTLADSKGEGAYESNWDVYCIENKQDIGDLMGAMHGIRHVGFIGELYRTFPFPAREEDFKQQPDGHKSRETVESVIKDYAVESAIPFTVDTARGRVSIGAYSFERGPFLELVDYVWRGGYPQWKDGIRPDCVLEMKNHVTVSRNPLFKGFMSSPRLS